MSQFITTRWSLVLSARGEPCTGRQALEQLCRAYRPPVLAYVRANGYPAATAEDLVQSFFLRFVEREFYADADAARGRFRTFLLTAVKRFLIDARKEATRLKRGGGQVVESLDEDPRAADAVAATDDPEKVFEREWALTVLQTALARLRAEAERAGKAEWFDSLSEFVIDASGRVDYAAAAVQLNVRANTLAVAVHRLRQRLRQLVLESLKNTVADPAALDAEMRDLSAALSQPGAA